MLNPFPIQFLSLFAYFILRVGLGYLLVRLGVRHIKNRTDLIPHFSYSGVFWLVAVSEVVLGTLYIVGFSLQYTALATILLSLYMFIRNKKSLHARIPGREFWTLVSLASLSLFITGAGILAFDLPI